jgi:hypothetical protein
MLTDIQIKQIKKLEIEQETIEAQIKNFKEGFPYTQLIRPATINDGIIKLTDKQVNQWIEIYDEARDNLKIQKFIPASGAASRMFKELLEFQYHKKKYSDLETFPSLKLFFQNINRFAFFNDLKNILHTKNYDITELIENKQYGIILSTLLDSQELNFKSLPKGLLKFHSYSDDTRTSVEEHLIEAFNYALSNNTVNLHFTILPEHTTLFEKEFSHLKEKYEKKLAVKINFSWSYQKKSTDTIAVDMNNEPLLDEKGLLVFRPGGHGALLDNLNDIDADLIFIKNIDNVAKDYLKSITYRYKKAIAGLLIHYKKKISEFLSYVEWHDTYSAKKRKEISDFLEKELFVNVPGSFNSYKLFGEFIKLNLCKPIRVCGMVENKGESGGGPFWISNNNKELSLQIVETSQVNPNDSMQQEILNKSTHFNPVDIVCSIKDNTGNNYNLLKYRNPNTGYITEKTINEKKIKAQELPGLWNGSMAHWISIFVEIPVETFTPVKTVNDLLRKEHMK